MQKTYYCPECGKALQKLQCCGSISYFCTECKKLISRSKIQEEPVEKEQTESD